MCLQFRLGYSQKESRIVKISKYEHKIQSLVN
jgi:hypothetical protein